MQQQRWVQRWQSYRSHLVLATRQCKAFEWQSQFFSPNSCGWILMAHLRHQQLHVVEMIVHALLGRVLMLEVEVGVQPGYQMLTVMSHLQQQALVVEVIAHALLVRAMMVGVGLSVGVQPWRQTVQTSARLSGSTR